MIDSTQQANELAKNYLPNFEELLRTHDRQSVLDIVFDCLCETIVDGDRTESTGDLEYVHDVIAALNPREGA